MKDQTDEQLREEYERAVQELNLCRALPGLGTAHNPSYYSDCERHVERLRAETMRREKDKQK